MLKRENNMKSHTFNVGDTVLVKAECINKLSTFNDPTPYMITAINGSMITEEKSDHKINTKTAHGLRNYQPSINTSEIEEDDISKIPSNTKPSGEINEQVERRYPLRQRKLTEFHFGQRY